MSHLSSYYNVEFMAYCDPEMNAYGSLDLYAFYQTFIYTPAILIMGE
jgi:hypothetical protein